MLSDWAFDYERMLIASEMAPVERDQALRVVNQLVVPLVGHLRVCELDDDLVRSVRRVVVVQVHPVQARYVTKVWAHFVGWVRYEAAPPERRNIWTSLDPEVTRTYDEYAGE